MALCYDDDANDEHYPYNTEMLDAFFYLLFQLRLRAHTHRVAPCTTVGMKHSKI